jgi:diguanylate cyclase (GGDEF)-like protein
MIDLDHFKAVNDKYGHPIGDEVLQSVAKLVEKCTKKKGMCYRYGGEEFTVLLPNYTKDEAVALAERLRREIEVSLL